MQGMATSSHRPLGHNRACDAGYHSAWLASATDGREKAKPVWRETRSSLGFIRVLPDLTLQLTSACLHDRGCEIGPVSGLRYRNGCNHLT